MTPSHGEDWGTEEELLTQLLYGSGVWEGFLEGLMAELSYEENVEPGR